MGQSSHEWSLQRKETKKSKEMKKGGVKGLFRGIWSQKRCVQHKTGSNVCKIINFTLKMEIKQLLFLPKRWFVSCQNNGCVLNPIGARCRSAPPEVMTANSVSRSQQLVENTCLARKTTVYRT